MTFLVRRLVKIGVNKMVFWTAISFNSRDVIDITVDPAGRLESEGFSCDMPCYERDGLLLVGLLLSTFMRETALLIWMRLNGRLPTLGCCLAGWRASWVRRRS